MKQNIRDVELPPGLETEKFLIGNGAIETIPEVFNGCFPGKDPWIVTDENIWNIAGERVLEILKNAGLNPPAPYIFRADNLHAHYRHVSELAKVMRKNCIPVSLGSGVINDFCKRLAFEKNCRYLSVPTACSVDGYTSYGAALIKDNFKQTLPCPAPLAIVADSDILRNAPCDMYAAGYADLAAKIPAGADWLIAEELGIESVRPDVWDLIQPTLQSRLEHPEDMEGIFFGLAATGYAMQLYRESRPASGAEHLFAHVLEMDNVDASHGFKVALGTLASISMYEWLFRYSASEIRSMMTKPISTDERREQVRQLTSNGHYGSDVSLIALGKFRQSDDLTKYREFVLEHWCELQRRAKNQLIPFQRLSNMFKHVGAPTKLDDLNLRPDYAKRAILISQLIRNRYTIVDLLFELGLLEQAADYAVSTISE